MSINRRKLTVHLHPSPRSPYVIGIVQQKFLLLQTCDHVRTRSGCDHRGQPSITSRNLRIKCGPARAIRSKRPFRPSSSRKGGRVMARIRRSRKTFPSIFPSKQSFPHQTEIWRASLRKGLKECLTRSNGISFCYRLCDHSSEDLSEDCGHNGTLEWHCG